MGKRTALLIIHTSIMVYPVILDCVCIRINSILYYPWIILYYALDYPSTGCGWYRRLASLK